MLQKLIGFLLLSLLIPRIEAQTLQGPKSGMSAPYVIQPNDLLEIFVWQDANLSRKALVRPDGRISFPLLQDIQAAGMTPVELKQQIEEGLKKFVEVSNVTVTVEAIQSYRVFVTGKVQKPGAISAEKPLSVLQVLALAGGFVDFANVQEIVVIRGSGEDSNLFKVNYPEVIKGKNFSQNMLLRNGDVVIVP